MSRRQLCRLGLSKDQIDGRLLRGTLHRIHQGVYAVGHEALTQRSRWMAAVLTGGEDAALSHRSACQLWGIAAFVPRYIEVTRPRRCKWRPGIRAHLASLPADELTRIDEIRVTSVFRTIFDLAAIAPRREVERAFHEAEVRGLRDRVSLPMLLVRYPGRRGAATIRRLLAGQAPLGTTQNEFEERFLAFLDAHEFPRPLLNGTLPLRGRLLRPDCMWPKARLIVELDGRAVHGTDRAFEGDRRRDRELLAEGWRSSRITWRQLRDEPEAIAADLQQALREPSPAPTPTWQVGVGDGLGANAHYP